MPKAPDERRSPDGISRRTFLKSAGGVAVGGVLAPDPESAPQEAEGDAIPVQKGEVEVLLNINGAERKLKVEPRTTLLDALRRVCDPPLTGTKEVCDRGNCGACTVTLDGRPAYSCLCLAADLEGRAIGTIESLGSPEELSPVQRAFCEKDALMCGFCTPGFVVALSSHLQRNPSASLDEIKHAISGNVCRCGTYPHIFEAALAAQAELKADSGGDR